MSPPSDTQVLRDRFRAFLATLRPQVTVNGADGDRLSQLRRVSELRIRQFSVGKPQVTALDLCALLAEPRTGRFDNLAEGHGLVATSHLRAGLPPLGEEMSYVVEACVSLQIVGTETMRACLKAFVDQSGSLRPPDGEGTAGRAAAPEAPLPTRVSRLLGSVRELWTVPEPVRAILEMLSVAGTHQDLVAGALEKDPALMAQTLRTANCALLLVNLRATSARQLLGLVEPSSLRWMVGLAALLGRIEKAPVDSTFDLKAFWSHSVWVAAASSLVARATKIGRPDEHFSAGLLHDIGRLAIRRYFSSQLPRIEKEGEEKVLGTDHCEIGAALCRRWGFPPRVVESAQHHLRPLAELEDVELPREAIVVTAMCAFAKKPFEGEETERACSFLRLPASRLPEVQAQAGKLASAALQDVLGMK
jgi:putative nucleotidyltransferase with HDIG domain